MKGPASHVSENGQYIDGLITPAGTVSDKLDTHLCPDKIKVCSGLLEVFALSNCQPQNVAWIMYVVFVIKLLGLLHNLHISYSLYLNLYTSTN